MTDRLLHWAADRARPHLHRPPRAAGRRQHRRLAAASATRQALESARRIGQALLDRGLSAERPVAILCENGLEHATLALGCLYAGVPYCAGVARPTPPSARTTTSCATCCRRSRRAWCSPPTPRYAQGDRRHGAARRRSGARRAAAGAVPGPAARPHGHAAGRAARHRSRRPAVDAARAGHRPGHHRQVPVHLGLDQAAQGGDQHPRACGAPTSSRCASRCRCWPRSRRCWSTGCPGTTPSAATTTSA